MASKLLKIARSKGERLGWTPIEQMKHVALASVTLRGRRLSINGKINLQSGDNAIQKLIIP